MFRGAEVNRATKETRIQMNLNIDGRGTGKVSTGIPFLDHMLNLFSAHGFFDLTVHCTGDIHVDYHHTVEDLGISLGSAFKEALGDKRGIRRYGEATVPMDEALARVVVDISNRPFIAYRVKLGRSMAGNFDVGLFKEFMRAFAVNCGATIHVDLLFGDDPHHAAEAIFKALARAMDAACAIEERRGENLPSTKGLM